MISCRGFGIDGGGTPDDDDVAFEEQPGITTLAKTQAAIGLTL